MPRALAIVAGTSAGSVSGARSTQTTPSAKASADIASDGQRQAGLADPARTGQGQQGNGLIQQKPRALARSASRPMSRVRGIGGALESLDSAGSAIDGHPGDAEEVGPDLTVLSNAPAIARRPNRAAPA